MKKSEIDPNYARRTKIIGVMGSGNDDHVQLSKDVGNVIAKLDYHLLNGGGGGVMCAVSEAFSKTPDRRGHVIGVIRAKHKTQLDDVTGIRNYSPSNLPNKWIEIPIFTHLKDSGRKGKEESSRNHINVLTADLVVGLPGGSGTLSEIELAIEYEVPLIFYTGSENIHGKSPQEFLNDYPLTVDIAYSKQELEEKIISNLGVQNV